MTATLHPPVGAGPQVLSQMTRDLVALAGGQEQRVRSGRGGLIVDDDLALAYLSTRPGARVPDPPRPAPLAIARLARDAEERGGLAEPNAGQHKPIPEPAAAAAPPATKPATRRRRVAARPAEEQA